MRPAFRALPIIVILAVVFLTPAVAVSQTTAADNDRPFSAGWRDGFVLQSEDGDYRLQLNGLFQADERFAVDDPQNHVVNTFLFRRIRPILQGRVAKYFDFYFNP